MLEVSPDDYGANLLLGRVLVLSGKPEAALPRLKKAAVLQPKAPDPHIALSKAYLKLGRDTNAAREQAEAEGRRDSRATLPRPQASCNHRVG